MSRKAKILVASLGAVVLGTGATLAVAQYGMGWRGHHHMREGSGFQLGMFCGDGSRVDRMLERVEERVKPTEAQKAAFADFKTAAKAAAEKVKSTCPIEAPRNIPERFGMTEKRLEAALDAVRTVRPAADKLYSALTDEQKAEVNGMRRGWGGGRGRN